MFKDALQSMAGLSDNSHGCRDPRCSSSRFGSRPLVGEFGGKVDSAVDKDSAAAVLVNPPACVERSGC
jgi:hypothetical protein